MVVEIFMPPKLQVWMAFYLTWTGKALFFIFLGVFFIIPAKMTNGYDGFFIFTVVYLLILAVALIVLQVLSCTSVSSRKQARPIIIKTTTTTGTGATNQSFCSCAASYQHHRQQPLGDPRVKPRLGLKLPPLLSPHPSHDSSFLITSSCVTYCEREGSCAVSCPLCARHEASLDYADSCCASTSSFQCSRYSSYAVMVAASLSSIR